MKNKQLSITKRITLVSIGLALFFLLVISAFYYAYFIYEQSERKRRNYLVSQVVSREIALKMTYPMHELRDLQAIFEGIETMPAEEMKDFYNSFLSTHSLYEYILFLNAQGVVTAAIPQDSNLEGLDMSRQEYFLEKSGRSPRWSDVFVSPLTGDLIVTISVTSKKSMIVGQINLQRLSEFLNTFVVGRNILAVVDTKGFLVASNLPFAKSYGVNLSNMVSLINAHANKEGVYPDSFEGESGISSATGIGNSGWHLIYFQRDKETMDRFHMLLFIVICSTMILLIVSIYFVFFVVRSFVRPIKELGAKTKLIAQGDYSVELDSQVVELSAFNEDLMQMIDAVRTREMALKESERKFRNLYESIMDGYVFMNDKGRFLEFNSYFQVLLGYTYEEMLGLSIYDILSKNQLEQDIEVADKQLSMRGYTDLYEKEIRCKDGALIPTEIQVYLMREFGGEKRYWAIIRDISQRKKAAEDQEKIQSQLLQISRLASIGELAAGVGHEINNPLAILKGNSEIFSSYLQSTNLYNAVIRRHLEKQDNAINRISMIVEGLKKFSHPEGGELTPFDVHEAIHDVLGLVGEMYHKDGILIKTDLAAYERIVVGNKGKFQQVILNLFSNAKDALEDRENRVIMVTTINNGPFIVIDVLDTGLGIEEHVLSKIFESFYTTKSPGKGAGLGLALSYAFVLEMGGRIEAHSKRGEGSAFTVTLPLSGKGVVVASSNSSQEEEMFVGHVLVVEDEEDLREIMHILLSSFGLIVTLAESGERALEIIKNQSFDYVITDVKMPGMSGIEFIGLAKSILPMNTLYFVITGAVTEVEMQITPDLVVSDFIKKPFSREGLHKTLSKHLLKK